MFRAIHIIDDALAPEVTVILPATDNVWQAGPWLPQRRFSTTFVI